MITNPEVTNYVASVMGMRESSLIDIEFIDFFLSKLSVVKSQKEHTSNIAHDMFIQKTLKLVKKVHFPVYWNRLKIFSKERR